MLINWSMENQGRDPFRMLLKGETIAKAISICLNIMD